ncbi:MAG: orc1/cdc6 family replication initiation protein [Candidatus Methanarcanum hacksteinii]|nr:orc1/cdc6 family replication initiation protein [Candidatus Methanarcanum hacksteinii]
MNFLLSEIQVLLVNFRWNKMNDEKSINKEESIFVQYVKKRKELIKDKKVLQTTYLPDELPHRKDQIDKIASIISTALNGEKPSNIMIYGMTGTGKTAVINYIGKELNKIDPDKDHCFYLYVNCEIIDTAYGILYDIAKQFIDDINQKIPFTGWSFEKLYKEFYEEIESRSRVFIIILDEIDHMISKKGDDIFYYLAKINEHLSRSKVSIIGISNNSKFQEMLEPKAKSRFGGESIIFPPYTKKELEDILFDRIKDVFEPNVLDDSVVEYCAALASRNDGDARMAIDLLRTATDIAERNGDSEITTAHVKSAKSSIEIDVVEESIKSLATQTKILLLSIIKISEKSNEIITTGDVYNEYRDIASIINVPILTQRRIGDLIQELDMMGLINASIKSLGRAGRTKEIKLDIQKEVVERFKKDSIFKKLDDYRPPNQTKLM